MQRFRGEIKVPGGVKACHDPSVRYTSVWGELSGWWKALDGSPLLRQRHKKPCFPVALSCSFDGAVSFVARQGMSTPPRLASHAWELKSCRGTALHKISGPFVPSTYFMPPCPHPRKRTTSFSEPLPRKTSRTMLRRTDSFLSLSDCENDSDSRSFLHMTSAPAPSSRIAPLHRARLHCPAQRDTANLGRKRAEFTIAPAASPSGTSIPKRGTRVAPSPKSPPAVPHLRMTSPLAPARKLLPPRACFPRSKPEPDLYRTALKERMRSSPEGEKILRMGPRLAIAILSATRELERIVSAHEDDDVMMGDETEPTTRWGLGRDMVAVSCGA